MLPAVQFDDELSFRTSEVDDVAADGKLPAKFVPVQLTEAEHLP